MDVILLLLIERSAINLDLTREVLLGASLTLMGPRLRSDVSSGQIAEPFRVQPVKRMPDRDFDPMQTAEFMQSKEIGAIVAKTQRSVPPVFRRTPNGTRLA